jgi:hypothetical protein
MTVIGEPRDSEEAATQ